jgi:cyanophycinase-like exopeptidase
MALQAMKRIPGAGWLALIGGGEFSFGETLLADKAWIDKTPSGTVGFVPAASDSSDYGRHFAQYLDEAFQREVETVPVYRERDARRGKNAERVAECAAVYLGGGVPDHLLETLEGTPISDALVEKLRVGGVVVAIAAAAQCAGVKARGIFAGTPLPGFAWLPEGVVETNFDPEHDRRLRRLLAGPGITWGLGIPAGSAVLFGPHGVVETVGVVFAIEGADGDLVPLGDPVGARA